MQCLVFAAECVIEGKGRRVASGASWRDTDDECVTCTCNVSQTQYLKFFAIACITKHNK